MSPEETNNQTEPQNKYLTDAALRQAVAEALARLELDSHQIRLAVLMHGEDVQTSEGETSVAATVRIHEAISRVEVEYAAILGGE